MKRLILLTLVLISTFTANAQNDKDFVKVTESNKTEYYVLTSSMEWQKQFVQFVHVTYNKPNFNLATTVLGNCSNMNYKEIAHGTKGKNGEAVRVEVKKPVVISVKKGTVAYELLKYVCSQKPASAKSINGENVDFADRYEDKWILINRDKESSVYYNPAKMRIVNGELYFWQKLEFLVEQEGVAYRLYYFQADCNRMAVKIVKFVNYSSNGKLLFNFNSMEEPWISAVPSSAGGLTLQRICRDAKP